MKEYICTRQPSAAAILRGSAAYPDIRGCVRLYQTKKGVLIYTEVHGLPHDGFYAFHIHEGSRCAPKGDDPFGMSGAHFNPKGVPHPDHAGDLPPLLAADGYALGAFVTDRFAVNEVLGRTVILHSHPDDFATQPSGSAGEKIACGIIRY